MSSFRVPDQLRGSSGGHGPLIADALAKGCKRLSPERRAAVIEARRLNPGGRQADIAAAAGVSRATVSRIEPEIVDYVASREIVARLTL